MSATKKCLKSSELEEALHALKRLRASLDPKGTIADEETLRKLNIVYTWGFGLKTNIEELVERSKLLGVDKLWSSDNLYRHLELLEEMTPRERQGASAHSRIEAFLFRISAMLPAGDKLVVHMQRQCTDLVQESSTTLTTDSGSLHYTMVAAKDDLATLYHGNPSISTLRNLNRGFFVVETNVSPLSSQIPKALCKLYAIGKQLGKERIRGALTNGHEWMFFSLGFNKDGEGASYKLSTVIQYCVSKSLNGEIQVLEPWPDLIAGILADWVKKGFDNGGGDDWFEVRRDS